MAETEPKNLGLVKNVRLKGDKENPFLRMEVTFQDDRSAPVSIDMRSTLAVQLAKQILALNERGDLGQ